MAEIDPRETGGGTGVNGNERIVGKAGNRGLTLAKLGFGLGLLALLVANVPLSELRASFGSVDLLYLAILFILPYPLMALATARWRLLLRALGLDIGFFKLVSLNLIGRFFSNFLPTAIGGDVVRTYQLSRDTNDASSVTAATVLDRLVGLVALVSLLPIVLLSDVLVTAFPVIRFLVPAALIGFMAAISLALSSRWSAVWQMIRGARFERLTGFLSQTRKAVAQGMRSIGALLSSFGISIAFYVGAALSTWVAAKTVGADVGFPYLMAIIPMVLLAAVLPISLNGLGVTEAGFALFLQLVGVSLADAVTIGLLLRGTYIVPSILGAFVFLRYRPAGPAPPAEAPVNLP